MRRIRCAVGSGGQIRYHGEMTLPAMVSEKEFLRLESLLSEDPQPLGELPESRPLVAVTLGDPAGIGPEIVLQACSKTDLFQFCRPLAVGDTTFLAKAEQSYRTGTSLHCVSRPEDGLFRPGSIDVLALESPHAKGIRQGEIQAEAGRCAYQAIVKATELALAGQIQAIATAPIHKEAIRMAGIPFIGHTEMLGFLTATPDPLTLFQTGTLRVFFLSRHLSLLQACALVERERLIIAIQRSWRGLASLGVEERRLAVAALNPHGGEHGLFGDEEEREIEPAIRHCRSLGIDVSGPIPADAVFHQALDGRYDAVLALYHDQGHIAAKTLDFRRTVSLTLGLPFLRTSVDHGTAFDIAGRGLADDLSMTEAISRAVIDSSLYNPAAFH
ncbi:MAG: 4-hydroxythreonine-4-phosphate dehydrogenase PdxA [Coprothermobacterota bacterium]|nr:4-hydroxythreonine-4-phosphate dehydrogenase PdxA [Coprothermobacterota bacterium]